MRKLCSVLFVKNREYVSIDDEKIQFEDAPTTWRSRSDAALITASNERIQLKNQR